MLTIAYEIQSSLVTKRTHNKIMRKVNRQAMTRHRQRLPLHFQRNSKTTPGGAYGYEKRNKRYQIRKAKQQGHQKPLVFTGRLKQSILSNVRITATAGRGRLKTRGYFPMRTQRRSEIEAIAPDERREMVARAERDYYRLARRPEFQRKRRKKRG